MTSMMNTLWTRSLTSTCAWIGSRAFLHTGSKHPAMPAAKPQEQPADQPGFTDVPEPERDSETIDPFGAKHRPRRRPGISDEEEFLRIQEAWANKLPLDEDPTIPEEIIMRPVRNHTQATTRKIFSNEALIRLQRKYDYSWGGIRRYVKRKVHETNVLKQRFIPMRHGILGPDLATAHFVTHRGGRVKFVGHAEWFTSDESLPKKFDENYLVEKVDATSLDLVWDGMDNICNLYYLEELNLTNNNQLDVFAFDKLCRQYRFSTKLRSLNVSRCASFCERSLETLHRIPSLEEVIITGTPAVEYKFLHLVIIMVQDINPKLKIVI